MSTQCGIAIKSEKGYETIYVHSDGYPEYMWPMLTENYNVREQKSRLFQKAVWSLSMPRIFQQITMKADIQC